MRSVPLTIGAIVFALVCWLAPAAYAADAEMDARIARLSALLRNDSSFKVRAYAARQLGALSAIGGKRDPRAIAALHDGLRDEDAVVRAVAADALGKHDAAEALQMLEKLAKADENELVRRAAASTIARLRQVGSPRDTALDARPPKDETSTPRSRRPHRVELGTVELEGAAVLATAVTDAIEALLEPHRPAMFPRESPDVRLELRVTRVAAKSPVSGGVGLAFEAHCVLVDLPGAQLRRASNATATAHTTKRSSGAIASLEKELALKAATRAVTEALAMLDE